MQVPDARLERKALGSARRDGGETMSVMPFFRWFDLWIGVYVDVANRAVYVCPVPMFGLKVQLAERRCSARCGPYPDAYRCSLPRGHKRRHVSVRDEADREQVLASWGDQ